MLLSARTSGPCSVQTFPPIYFCCVTSASPAVREDAHFFPLHSMMFPPSNIPGERRVWISVRMPADSARKLSSESKEVLRLWESCLLGDLPLFPLALDPFFPCEAFADACADSRHVGIGGFVSLPDSRTVWFRSSFSVPELLDLFPWFPSGTSPQKLIASWELLGQIALLWCVALLVPAAYHPVHFTSRCDNSPADSAAWKGLSTARGLCSLLRSYFLWQRHFCVSTFIEHVPGFRNVIADGLSRGKDPSSFHLRPDDEVCVPWQLISSPPRGTYSPESAYSDSKFPALRSLAATPSARSG